jgi:hypothetical protein
MNLSLCAGVFLGLWSRARGGGGGCSRRRRMIKFWIREIIVVLNFLRVNETRERSRETDNVGLH